MDRYLLRTLPLLVALTATACNDSQGTAADALACDAEQYDVLGGLNLQTSTVLDVQLALTRGAFTSEELVRHQLTLIEAFDHAGPALNSVRAIAPSAIAQARAADERRRAGQVRGPIDGVTVLLKDNIGTTDLPTTAGSIALASNTPLREATITRRLREAGAIILGKANMSEFANWMDPEMPQGYSSLGGQVIAPYPPNADPSGSSSGSGVAGAMGFASLTVGTETYGSIIAPSWRNGLVGVKPTRGLVSRVGIIPLKTNSDTAGPMTRTVTDAAAMLKTLAFLDAEDTYSERFAEALSGEAPEYLAALSDTALQGARIGVRESDLSPVSQAAAGAAGRLFNQAIAVLRTEGAEIVSINDALAGADIAIPLAGGLVANANEFKFSLNRYLAEESGPDALVATLSDIIEYNAQYPDQVKYGQRFLQLSEAQTGSEVDPLYLASQESAVLSAQTYLDTVFELYGLDALVSWDLGNGGVGNVSSTATAGYPNIAVPIGYADDAPHGIDIGGRPFEEAKLLAYAFDYEQATQARRSPPQVNAALLENCS